MPKSKTPTTNKSDSAKAIPDKNLNLYEKLFRIRESEKEIIKHYNESEMKTPMHMSLGSEAIAVGVCEALGKQGQFFCSYRSHAVYLTNTGETDAFFAELYGKSTGIVKGRGGSMHLSSPKTGFFGASAIVASTLPPAIGAAYANKMKSSDKVVCVFFGDGAIDEGSFWESLNMACLMKLAVLFVCEDNGYAVHNPTSARHGYSSIAKIVEKFNCNVYVSDSTDVEKIHHLARRAVNDIKKSSRPSFLHLKYYRYLRHVGTEEDFAAGYRQRNEFERWLKIDPVKIQREKIAKLGIGNKKIQALENKIIRKIKKSIQLAKSSPFPSKEHLYEKSLKT